MFWCVRYSDRKRENDTLVASSLENGWRVGMTMLSVAGRGGAWWWCLSGTLYLLLLSAWTLFDDEYCSENTISFCFLIFSSSYLNADFVLVGLSWWWVLLKCCSDLMLNIRILKLTCCCWSCWYWNLLVMNFSETMSFGFSLLFCFYTLPLSLCQWWWYFEIFAP